MKTFWRPKYLKSLIAAVNDGAKSAQAGSFLFLLVGLYLLATACGRLTTTKRPMETFEPPKYLTSLIAAVNDGAKSAQAGSFLFLLVGLYLLATAFSASDEDLLLGKAMTISQIGTSLPVSFSFAIAPLVFVFLHIYALVRYDMLAANVRQFVQELHDAVTLEADRERCRQLLANVEFILVLTTPRNSALYSRFWRWLFRGIAAVFPVLVLLLVQINALRYQSELIVTVQRATLALDLVAVIWFFRRNALDGSGWPHCRLAKAIRWTGLLWAPIFIVAVNWFYLTIVSADADAALVRYNPDVENPPSWLAYATGNPLDRIACPQLNWGCRFLRVDHRTLVQKGNEGALGILQMDISFMAELEKETAPEGEADEKAKAKAAEKVKAEKAKAMATIEGVFLRKRSLRFAVLAESRLYAADLIGADLRNADLSDANLSDAKINRADLSFAHLADAHLLQANLSEAILSGANLNSAKLNSANLRDADLSGADLNSANLNSADLRGADLSGADLSGGVDLSGANLSRVNLSDAKLIKVDQDDSVLSTVNLSGAKLIEADLSGANLSTVNLSGADLSGADLSWADLGRANLNGANLTGANPSDANLYGADLRGANLNGADLRGADLSGANLTGADLRAFFLPPKSSWTNPAALPGSSPGPAQR